jgi:hypothetical protein
MFRSLYNNKKTKKVNFFDYINANEFLDIVSGLWKEGKEGALFLPIGRHAVVAEKMAEDLFISNNETYKRYAAKLIGFIESPKRPLFITFYRAEQLFYNSLQVGDLRRNNSHEIIEDLIISTVIRFDLGYQNNKSAKRIGNDWIDFLFEVVNDAINEYNWNSFQLALSILSFHFYQKDWFKVLLSKYEEYIVQTTDNEIQINRNLYDEIKRRNGESEIFESLLNNVVIPKINVAKDWKLDNRAENIINGIINFYKNK